MAENLYTVSPDVVSHAIKILGIVLGAVGSAAVIIGGGLIKTMLFVGSKIDTRFTNIEEKMDKIAGNIEGMDKSTALEISGIKLRCSMIHTDDPRAQIRSSDFTSACDRGTGGR